MTSTDSHTLCVLEWDRLCAALAERAATHWGRNELLSLTPDADPAAYRHILQQVSVCMRLHRQGRHLPLSAIPDVEPLRDRASVEGAHLDAPDLRAAAELFRMTGELRDFGDRSKTDDLGGVGQLLTSLQPAPGFCRTIDDAFEPDGTLKDQASPQLRSLRRLVRQLESTILSRLQKTAASLGGDAVVTMREGRHVVSVIEHDRGKVPGVVHDRSQSGTTYFVEPTAVLEMGNDLKSAEADLRYEVIRILTELTSMLRGLIGSARHNIPIITTLDSLWARARWAESHGADVAHLVDEPGLRLQSARHPLLVSQCMEAGASLQTAGERVIPFDLVLDDSRRGLIISGPNTGGKTVCLKTLGLSVLMTQCGVPITAAPESVVGSFDAVFADIGDEQSLALSLSTFSAHLQRVGEACRGATSRSLVLVDELGVGTDPEEGTALARAVIHSLVHRGAAVVVTTHYSALKLLHEEDRRIENAAFLFNEEALAPTYELVTGRPGQSYALDIARRLSFPEEVVAAAQAGVRDETRHLSALITRLTERETELARLQAASADEHARLAALHEFNRETRSQLERLQRTAQADAKREAAHIVEDVRRQTEQLVARIRESQAHRDVVRSTKKTLGSLVAQTRPDQSETANRPDVDLAVGMRVRIDGIAGDGEIMELHVAGRRVSVLMGNITHNVPCARIRLWERAATSPAQGMRTGPSPVDYASSTVDDAGEPYELDLRGRTVEEAQIELEDMLEPLARQGVGEVRVIHGRGTGALKRALSAWFRSQPRVESFRRGGPGEGGDGVTVVVLKQP